MPTTLTCDQWDAQHRKSVSFIPPTEQRHLLCAGYWARCWKQKYKNYVPVSRGAGLWGAWRKSVVTVEGMSGGEHTAMGAGKRPCE